MPSDFRALVVVKDEQGYRTEDRRIADGDLMDGDVTVRVTHSTVNYKDGLAITGRSPVVRRFPLVPGIDFAGVVEQSSDARYRPGDAVVLTGWGVGETHSGGYAERARVRGDWLVPLASGLTPAQAMAVGTAGFTAMQSVMAQERHGMTPADGPAIVTGAAGGVGSVAVSVLAKLGWRVIASTGRSAETEYLTSLGASEVIDRSELTGAPKPLARERWAAGVDSVGSTTLANVLSMTMQNGAIAACGLAQGMDLPTSVAPFILRGIALLGVNSVPAPRPLRLQVWDRIARDLDMGKLAAITRTIGFDEIVPTATAILDGKVRGRTVVEIN